MKKLLIIISIFSQVSFAQSYTLAEVCAQYDEAPSTCEVIPFCASEIVSAGCQVQPGQPDYVEALCKLHNQEQFCKLQPGCQWSSKSQSFCENTRDRL